MTSKQYDEMARNEAKGVPDGPAGEEMDTQPGRLFAEGRCCGALSQRKAAFGLTVQAFLLP